MVHFVLKPSMGFLLPIDWPVDRSVDWLGCSHNGAIGFCASTDHCIDVDWHIDICVDCTTRQQSFRVCGATVSKRRNIGFCLAVDFPVDMA